jgi:2-isopropylmalate synthase
MPSIQIYDTTLRDGTQAEGISLSCEDKIKIAQYLDKMGIHYIEGGYPGSNPKDVDFFNEMRNYKFKHARLAGFGSTRRAKSTAESDANLNALVNSGVSVATIFGKSWDMHVTTSLRTTLEENLAMIRDTVAFLKRNGLEVFFDAEHFFDGFKANPEYALAALEAAEAGGASTLVLCDTNGGSMPLEVKEIVEAVAQKLRTPLGIHAHNDGELAVANSLIAVQSGAIQVQGTINGYGERCGNANLCSIIPNLSFKPGLPPAYL